MIKGENDVVVPVIATLPNGQTIENTVELNVKSPCSDSETATITDIELSEYAYLLFATDGPRSPHYSITHTEPELISEADCGAIATRVEWNGLELGSTTEPIMYRFDQKRLGIYSEDPMFAGAQTLKFTNYLYEYPENRNVQEFEIAVGGICESPLGMNANEEN